MDTKSYTIDQLRELQQKATVFATTRDPHSSLNQFEYLYRDKSKSYFDFIFENKENVMEIYPKDDGKPANGDPRSPVNALNSKGRP